MIREKLISARMSHNNTVLKILPTNKSETFLFVFSSGHLFTLYVSKTANISRSHFLIALGSTV